MRAPSIFRKSLGRIGFTAPSLVAEEAPLPVCTILEEEYGSLNPGQAPRLDWLLADDHLRDLPRLAGRLHAAREPAAAWLASQLTAETGRLLKQYARTGAQEDADKLRPRLVGDLNGFLERGLLSAQRCFKELRLTGLTRDLLQRGPTGDAAVYLNRLLLEEAYPDEIAPIHERRPRFEQLQQFDYLSTVSGGGYIGSWLTAWINRDGRDRVLEDLRRSAPECPPDRGTAGKSPVDPEPAPIGQLRAYSNYLSPKLGLLSADTWTLVAIYLRNLVLNWLVLLPLLAAVLLFPVLAVTVVRARPAVSLLPTHSLIPWTLVAGFGLGVLAVRYVHAHWPSAAARPAGTGDQSEFLRWCLFPLLGATVILTTAWAWIDTSPTPLLPVEGLSVAGITLHPSVWLGFTAFGALIHLTGWALAQRPGTRARLGQVPGIVVTGAAAGFFAYLAAVWPFRHLADETAPGAEWYVCLAAPLFLVVVQAGGTLYVGVTSRWTEDEDREWSARFGAWLLIAAVAWSVVSLMVIFGPAVLFYLGPKARLTMGSLGGIAGLVTLLGGFSPETPGSHQTDKMASRAARLALPLTAPLFAASLIVLLSLANVELVRGLAPPADPACGLSWRWYDPGGLLQILHCAGYRRVAALLGGLVLFGFAFAFLINTNRFSLHAMYRDRLIRAYLGASRAKRRPNLFTGFDPQDNTLMHALWPSPAPRDPAAAPDRPAGKPLHVINISLNLVSGKKLAWQQRKAEPFTVTALHAGSHRTGFRRTWYPDSNLCYGGEQGISLGTAMTISGAAASPNMGYHTSPVVAFLMTLFNVRLGWWLGNPGPAGQKTFPVSFPVSAIRPIIDEAFGLTDDDNKYVYLSDGGHFENLGLYEMVLRRCRVVLLSDAGCDPKCTFDDLGNAIRKIRIDLGVPIEMDTPLPIFPRKPGASRQTMGKYCALGRIRYSCVDGTAPEHDGRLVYLKPAFYGDEPSDIYNYAQRSPAFPHEPTTDQFFSESQLESYRALGYYIATRVFAPESAERDGRTLEQRARDYLRPAIAQP